MSAYGPYLRRTEEGYLHWCPGCGEAHYIAVDEALENGARWTFNQSAERPTFNPSVRIRGVQRVIENGKWTGEWKKDAAGKPLDGCCHYFIRDGQIQYCGDCTHDLNGQTVPLPEFPDGGH